MDSKPKTFSTGIELRRSKLAFVAVMVLSFLNFASRAAIATDYYVRPDGNDSNSGTGPEAANAWATVTAAATKSLSAGDVVYIQAGTYSGEVVPTVSGSSGSPIQFVGDKDGLVTGWSAGNIVLQAPAGLHVLDAIGNDYLEFYDIHFLGDTGRDAIDVKTSSGTLFDSCIISNGYIGLEVDGATLTIKNCLFYGNANKGIVVGKGAGTENVTIWNTTIANNSSDGVTVDSGVATITNSIVAFNSSDGFDLNAGTLTHTYNLVYGNGDLDFEGTSISTGELNSDPLFIGGGNYRLQASSPAIDAGTSAAGIVDDDIAGNPRPNNNSWDMGSYEQAASVYYVSSDGNDSNTGTGPGASEAWATVAGAAIKSLSPGDIVYVQAGTYTGQVNPTVSGTSIGPIQFIADTSGSVSGWSAGEVVLTNSISAVMLISACDYLEFSDFKVVETGGSFYALSVKDSCTGIVVRNCEVTGGTRGISLVSSTATVINCLVHNNTDRGIHVGGTGSDVDIWNSTIVDNLHGVYHADNISTLTNSIIANNTNQGVYFGGGTFTHTYNLVYGNGTDYVGTSASTGELSVDPLFSDTTTYRLQESSPAIDAGTNALGTVDEDIDKISRPINSNWDMGCYEGTGMVAYWKLNELAGTSAADSSGMGHDGTYTGGTALNSEGPYPGDGAIAAEFDGADDYVDVVDINVDFSQGFTAAMWVKPTAAVGSGEYVAFLDLSNGMDTDEVWLGWVGIVGFQLYMTDTADGSPLKTIEDNTDFEVDKWVHCVATIDASGNATLYRDGKVTKTGFYTSLPANTTRTEVTLGTSPWDDYFSGRLDEVRIYNRALSAEEIALLYGMVGQWKFDEAAGTTVADSTAFANDGTVAEASWSSDCIGNSAIEFDGVDDSAATDANFDPSLGRSGVVLDAGFGDAYGAATNFWGEWQLGSASGDRRAYFV